MRSQSLNFVASNTTSDFISNLLESNVINIIILISLLIYLGKRTIVTNLNDRKLNIQCSILEAEKKLSQAQLRLAEAEKKITESEEIISILKHEAKIAANKIKELIVNNAKRKIDKIILDGKTIIANTEIEIMNQIKNRIISTAIDKTKIKLTKNLQAETIERITDNKITFLNNNL
uniref:ATP synthase subunit b, chloroplastic n=1 Tax=Cyanidium caldarium TaxID=2771 RepID=ATPF_CYACA|nr:ATP synthase CF0 B chain [Cyanidium caldarium]Q9TM28.1 RecName: Full=ATP synthase subunit b, chloroplastic; AltName: Full=ATP synthase F(0) sector subunit b; AltName: Full=ATPase subunit I [Cyanidium caldarium]AAF13007.1 unknown [Cyanidium caldarium]WDB00166.1 ATP synthase CF0 B chain [Cyanidium caldarium]